MKRFEQMTPDEMSCCASGFSISGFGSPFMFRYLESAMIENIADFSAQNIQELCRAFIYSQRGSKILHQVLMPRITAILHTFTCNELCYMMYGYHKAGFLPKPFA